MRTILIVTLTAAAAAALTGCAALRLNDAAKSASGYTSHLLCSNTFVGGQDPDRVYADVIRPQGAMNLVGWALRYDVDRAQRRVTTTLAGGFRSRAVHHDGLGCLVLHGDEPDPALAAPLAAPAVTPLQPDIAGPDIVAPAGAAMQAAFDRAFAEPGAAPYRNTHAVIVLRDGKIIAERYAPGRGIATPMHGWSVTKSALNALIGILVRQGKLNVGESAPLAAWQSAGDPRRTITIDQLLRQTPGLDFEQTNSGFDPTTFMSFVARDPAAMAAAAAPIAAPGTRWNYTDANYMLLSRIVRDAVGGEARDVLQFAQRELWGPLGMRHATLEFDATGTPMGAAFMFASARDWVRFGLLYLNDGVAGETRLLPPGWVRYAAAPTLGSGYSAGFWNNTVDGNVPGWGVPWGLPSAPRDTFFARGNMGQFIVVVPSRRIVIARFGASQVRGDDIGGMDELVGDVLATVGAQAGPAQPSEPVGLWVGPALGLQGGAG